MIGALIGSMVGWKLGEKYLSGTSETPMWTGHVGGDVGKPAVSVTAVRFHGKRSYRVYVATAGQWALVAAAQQWGEVLAVLQQWEDYLAHGGTIAAWLMQNTRRAEEIRQMEEAFRR